MSPKDKINKVGEASFENMINLSKTLRGFVLTSKSSMSEAEFIQYKKDMVKQVKQALNTSGEETSKASSIVNLIFDLDKPVNEIPQNINDILTDD